MSSKPDRVSLCNGNWTAEIIPGYSANLISLKYIDEEIMRTTEDCELFVKNHITYGTAFLLPPDRTLGGSFIFDDCEYHLPINDSRKSSNIHGLMTDAVFDTVYSSSSEAIFRYENNGTRYPFPFTITVSYTLRDACIITYEFENTGSTRMPLLFGLHANFKDFGFVKVPVAGEMYMNMETLVPDPIIKPLSEIGKMLKNGIMSTGVEISNFFTSAGNKAEIGPYDFTVSDNMTHWVVWNGTGKDGFISVEPENGPVNGLNIQNACTVLEKGGKTQYTIEIRRRNQWADAQS